MIENEWSTKAKICNAVGIDMVALQQYFNVAKVATKRNGNKPKEFKLLGDDSRLLNGPAVEAYKPSNGGYVREGGLDFKKIKSVGIG